VKNKIYSILLLIAFITAIIQPAVPFVQYYFYEQSNQQVTSINYDCGCSEQNDSTHPIIVNAYLKALLKRACKDQKKDIPKIPVVSISVFVQNIYQNKVPVYQCPEQNFQRISDFIIQPVTSSHIEELFRPPRFS